MIQIAPSEALELSTTAFDLAVWAAGYEQRAGWLVQSNFAPNDVQIWVKVEFEEGGDVLHGPANQSLHPEHFVLRGHRSWDGWWHLQWRKILQQARERRGTPIRVFVDYSSMPRTVYGPLVLECLRECEDLVGEIVLSYVPGRYTEQHRGSRRMDGLRSLVGTEGRFRAGVSDPAMVLGLGFDGLLAEAVTDLYQIEHFSAFLASPGINEGAAARAKEENRYLLSCCERVASAPAADVAATRAVILDLCDWYLGHRPVLLVPLGPKPHVLAAILAAVDRPDVAFRYVRASWERFINVEVADDAVPLVTTIMRD